MTAWAIVCGVLGSYLIRFLRWELDRSRYCNVGYWDPYNCECDELCRRCGKIHDDESSFLPDPLPKARSR